jgi:predicted metal-dependent hydrolase
MALTEAIRARTSQHFLLDGQKVEWRLVRSSAAKKLRIKVGPDGVVVVLPDGRDDSEAAAFVASNRAWVAEQLARTRKLQAARRPQTRTKGQLLFRGELIAVRVLHSAQWRGPNKVTLDGGVITITCGQESRTSTDRSLENWLRKQARERIGQIIAEVGKRVNRAPNRVYVMGQRTKWGNCSALGNLSFNWRLIMAPDYVLRYIVSHEMAHLAIPDHSTRFWLTVQSLCLSTDRARQWLVANTSQLIQTHPIS